MSRIADLLARGDAALQRSMNRPLIRGMIDGTVTDAEFTTYLEIEGRFVRTAARLLGYCIWQEPSWDVTVRHAASLAGLVGEQSEYFAARAVPGLSLPGASLPAGALPAGFDALEAVVNDAVATGGYPAVLTCLCAAETLYGTWCAAAGSAHDRADAVDEWIRMHTTPSFASGVAFLQERVDAIDPAIFSDADLDLWFTRMLEAEDTFHDSALSTGASV